MFDYDEPTFIEAAFNAGTLHTDSAGPEGTYGDAPACYCRGPIDHESDCAYDRWIEAR